MTTDKTQRWTLVEVTTHTDAVEALCDALTEMGAVGATTRQENDDIGTTRVVVEAYYAPTEDSSSLLAAVRQRLDRIERAGLSVEPARIAVRTVREENWATSWRSYFAPQRYGDRLLVTPPWEPIPSDAPSAVVVLEPGMAFGTGAHASTQLVLRFLTDLPLVGRRVADIGTGSGILAIASAQLGASEVVALDSDPQAIQVAASNVRRNGTADCVHLFVGRLDALSGRFDVVLMNILASVIVPALPSVWTLLASEGFAVFSGITDAEAESVQTALHQTHYDTIARTSNEGWTAFLVRPLPFV